MLELNRQDFSGKGMLYTRVLNELNKRLVYVALSDIERMETDVTLTAADPHSILTNLILTYRDESLKIKCCT